MNHDYTDNRFAWSVEMDKLAHERATSHPGLDSHPPYYLRAGWLIVLIGVGGFLLWALLWVPPWTQPWPAPDRAHWAG